MRLDRNEMCPCGSGLEYGRCCWDKDFEWVRGRDGSISRAVPITEDTLAALRQAEDQFRHVFRRAPEPGERIMVGAYISSEEDGREQLDRLLAEVGIDKARRYATWKTGLIPVEGQEGKLPEVDLQEWEEAVVEYEEIASMRSEAEPSERDRLLDAVDPEVLRLPYVFGMFLTECAPHVCPRPSDENRYMAGSVFHFATKALKTFEAIQTLTKHNLGEDALALGRNLYESYLHVLYAIRSPEEHGDWTKARIGLERDTHAFRISKSGKPDFNVIVDVETGKETEANIPNRRMAASSPFDADLILYDVLYSRLSDYTHPQPRTILSYLSPTGWDIRRRDMILPADLYGYAFALLTLDAAAHLGSLPERRLEDVQVYVRHARQALSEYLRFEVENGVLAGEFSAVIERVQECGRPWI